MTPEYLQMTRAAAAELGAALRAGRNVAVWAVFTTAEENGRFHVSETPPAVPLGRYECVHAPAAYGGRWGLVPYSAHAQVMAELCRRLPILPVHMGKPCAAPGLTSYRYRGRYGFVMIGAAGHADALREARRSIDGPADPSRLEIWDADGGAYQPAGEG